MAKKRKKEEMVLDMADLFKLFGDSTRLYILCELRAKECSVGELAERLMMTPSAISHQLKTLKSGKLVKARRDGKQIFYSLADTHVSTIIDMGEEHIKED